jgi:hypothetical protein
MKTYEFKAVIVEAIRGGAYIEFPLDARTEFGSGGQIKVKATFDGHPYSGSLAPMGGGKHVLGILKDIRKQIGKDIGAYVHVTITHDIEERVVSIPPELQKAFNDNLSAKAKFEALSFSHRREYANYIADAKKDETRISRAAKVIEKLLKL